MILNVKNKKYHVQSKSLTTKSTQLDVALCKEHKYSKSSIEYKDRFLAEMELHIIQMY